MGREEYARFGMRPCRIGQAVWRRSIRAEDERLLLTVQLFNENNELLVQVLDNELVYSADQWDVEFVGRAIGDTEIVERLVYALVNEAAYILAEGIASKASDIDMVYLTGYGFPLFRGGPMRYADEVGLYNVVRAMRRYDAADTAGRQAGAWKPAPLLAKLAAEGGSFTG